MGDIVNLRDRPTPLEDDLEFISDLARFADNLLSEAAVKKKIALPKAPGKLSAAMMRWSKKLKPRNYAEYVMAAPSEKRRSNWSRKRPTSWAALCCDPNANERHRIDSIKTLDALASTGAEARGGGGPIRNNNKFGLRRLEVQQEHRHRPRRRHPSNHIDTTDVIAAIATKKPTESGDGNDSLKGWLRDGRRKSRTS